MTAPTTPNAALAYRVLDHIDAHPEQWNQGLFIGPADCETVACFAGWACLLSGEQPNYAIDGSKYSTAWLVGHEGKPQSVGERAEQLLGVERWSGLLDEDDEEWNLFGASNTREELGWLVAEMFGPRPVDWDKPLEPVMGVPASGCDCSHDGGHGLAPWPDRSRGHAEDCPAFGPRPDGGEVGNATDGTGAVA